MARLRSISQPCVADRHGHKTRRILDDPFNPVLSKSANGIFATELRFAILYSRRLQRLHADSTRNIDEGLTISCADIGHQSSVSLTAQQCERIRQIGMGQTAIIVLGHSCFAKASVVNDLLGISILPSGVDGDEHWRMVTFQYGEKTEFALVTPDGSYALMDDLEAYDGDYQRIPRSDLVINGGSDPANHLAVLEVKAKNALLRHNVLLVMSPSGNALERTLCNVHEKGMVSTNLVLYAIESDVLTPAEEMELRELRQSLGKVPVLFVVGKQCATPGSQQECELTESEQHDRKHDRWQLKEQLTKLGFSLESSDTDEHVSELTDSLTSENVTVFISRVLKRPVLEAATLLSTRQRAVLDSLILGTFDFARDRNVTPVRLKYAKNKELELYHELVDAVGTKQEEIRALIVRTIESLRAQSMDMCVPFDGVSPADLTEPSCAIRAECTAQLQEYLLEQLNSAIVDRLVDSATLLKKTSVGTLQRCVDALERTCRSASLDDSIRASQALRRMLGAANELKVPVRTSRSYLSTLLQKMRRMFTDFPGRQSQPIDRQWQRRVAKEFFDSLSDAHLTEYICIQYKAKLREHHVGFTAALAQLQADHEIRIEHLQHRNARVCTVLIPRIARCYLETMSLRDVLLFGLPVRGKEIGRGRFGTVYACESWAGRGPLAVKRITPHEETHWNSLAMEYFYMRSLPPHDRIATLVGSVIEYRPYPTGTPSIFIVMDRCKLDLHTALDKGLPFTTRIKIAQDVIEGIQFLHSQGLIHRDIKLKNVLLDEDYRAKLTDFGFCNSQVSTSVALMGTPIHMAPELFKYECDYRVDTYAFGILFWYLCNGGTSAPSNFSFYTDKHSLWRGVRHGLRPERRSHFYEQCWRLMSECWHHDPERRPHLRDVANQLTEILLMHSRTLSPLNTD